jgi:hypothetical protein
MGKDTSCIEGECEVETVRNIRDDYVVSDTVIKISEFYVVALKLHDVGNAALLAGDSVRGKEVVPPL